MQIEPQEPSEPCPSGPCYGPEKNPLIYPLLLGASDQEETAQPILMTPVFQRGHTPLSATVEDRQAHSLWCSAWQCWPSSTQGVTTAIPNSSRQGLAVLGNKFRAFHRPNMCSTTWAVSWPGPFCSNSLGQQTVMLTRVLGLDKWLTHELHLRKVYF